MFAHCSIVVLLVALTVVQAETNVAAACVAASKNKHHTKPPFVTPRIMQNGQVMEVNGEGISSSVMKLPLEDVMGCCGGETETAAACSDETKSGTASNVHQILSPQLIGKMPQMNEEQTMQVLEHARKAWNGGSGVWPQMSLEKRVECLQHFFELLKNQRELIVQVLMWEIGKNRHDAENEFDRTVEFAQHVMNMVRTDSEFMGASWQTSGSSTRAFVRRAAIGIWLALGPYNYPLNETYATIIPALLMGNVVILKIPTTGGLVHLLTMEAFSKALPHGAIHFVSGRGRATMPPLMASNSIDGLAFIGGSNAADDLMKQHPHPHRLKVFLQLEANNMGIFLSDVFEPENTSLLESSLNEAVSGSLSFNGQRCTALKLLLVPTSHASTFAKKFAERVESLAVGLPWKTWEDGSYSKITPLPNQSRVEYMKRLIEDAVRKGATILNKNGGSIVGGPDSTLMVPAVLFPVTSDMDVYHEEQFGPVVPIAPYDDVDTILAFGRDGEYAQQVSIFTAKQEANTAADIVDKFSTVFGKININTQCGRSPDTLPFSGRRSSAMGVMSVKDALREFSVPTVVAYKDKGSNRDIAEEIQKSSTFLVETAVA